jgi:hypothetical protein
MGLREEGTSGGLPELHAARQGEDRNILSDF